MAHSQHSKQICRRGENDFKSSAALALVCLCSAAETALKSG